MSSLRALVAKVVQPLQQRILLSIGRALITGTDDSTKAARLQLAALKGEVMGEVEQILAYGITSRVLPADETGSAEALFVCVGGSRDHPVAVGTEDRRHRPVNALQPGEVMIYDDQGIRIHLKRGSLLEINVDDAAFGTEVRVLASRVTVDCDNADINATELVRFVAPLTRVEGNLEVTGGVVDDADGAATSMAGMRSVYNGHTHPHTPHGPPTQQM